MSIIQKSLTGTECIGIGNRGEPAFRFIRAVRDFNIRMQTSLKTVVFYLEVEKDAPFVQEADVAVPFPSNEGSSYIQRELMIDLFRETDCSAVWLGWGFLSEDAVFVKMIEGDKHHLARFQLKGMTYNGFSRYPVRTGQCN